jgi:hypothetical protein
MLVRLLQRANPWALIALIIVIATRIYYVRELMAALVIFLVLFMAGTTIVLIVCLLSLVAERLLAWIERGVAYSLRWAIDVQKGLLARQRSKLSYSIVALALQDPQALPESSDNRSRREQDGRYSA